MRVTCTDCSAVFNLPDEKLEGRTGTVKVRCPACDKVLELELALEDPDAAEPAEPSWYYSHGEAQEGPVTEGALRDMIAAGTLTVEDLVWKTGMDDWAFVQDVPAFSGGESPAEEPASDSEESEAPPAEAEAPPADEDGSEPEPEPEPEPQDGEDASPEDIADQLAAEMAEEDEKLDALAPVEVPAEDPAAAEVDDEPDWAEESRDLLDEISKEEELVSGAAVPEFEEPEAEEPASGPEAPPTEEEEPEAEEPASGPEAPPTEEEEAEAEEPEAEESEESDALAEAKSLLARVEELDGGPAAPETVMEEPVADDAVADEPGADAPAADEEESHGSLFAQFDSGDGEDAAAEAADDRLLHTRRETSVLFSLDDLSGNAVDKAASDSTKEGDSGLIDIRTIAMDNEEDDDVFGAFGTGDSRVLPDVGAAAVAMPLVKRRKRWPIFLAAGIVVLIGLGIGGFLGKDHIFPGVSFMGEIIPDAVAGVKVWQAKRVEELQETYTKKLETVQEEGAEAVKAAQRALDARYEQARTAAEASRLEHKKAWDARLATLEGSVKDLEKKKTEKIAAQKAKADAEAAEKARLEAARKADELAKADAEAKVAEAAKAETAEKAAEKKAERRVTDRKKTEKAGEKTAEVAKVDKKVEKKAEKTDTGGKKDAAALLAAIDKKKAGGDSGDDAEAAKPSKKTLTLSDITRVVRSNKGKMTACFNKYGSGLSSARISTRVTIEGSGSVSSVTIATREYAGTALGNCVKNVVKKMTFPAFSGKPVKKPIAVSLP
jgi:predicted Zn finger-like uncharacterized protein